MQKFTLFTVIAALATTATAVAMENPGAPSVKPTASMAPTARGVAPGPANLAMSPPAASSAAMSAQGMSAQATSAQGMSPSGMSAPGISSLTASPRAMAPRATASLANSSSLAASPPATTPNAASSPVHSSMAVTANAERAAAPRAGASAASLSSSPSAGLTAPGISRNTIATQANLATKQQTAQSLLSPAMVASVAHTSAAAAQALPNKKGNVSAAMRSTSMQNVSPPAKVRRQ
jgi:hypothetical protein